MAKVEFRDMRKSYGDLEVIHGVNATWSTASSS